MKSLLQMPEFKVGLLVLGVAALIAIMSLRVSEDPSVGGAKKHWFLSPNAGGLVKKSAVKMAGIPIGVISDISLENGIARIAVVIRNDVDLTQSARVEIKANGILGDKYVEVYPGLPEDGKLKDGEQILIVNDKSSIDGLVSQISDISSSLKDVALTLKDSVENQGTDKHILGRVVQNIESLTKDLADVTHENKDRVTEILENLNGVTRDINTALANKETGFNQAWGRLDKVLKNIEDVTTKIKNGEGTIGKLVNDERTVEELNSAVEGISNILDTTSRLQTSVDFRTEYLGTVDLWKSYIGVKFQPGLDRYYLLQVVDDPSGVQDRSSRVTSSDPGGTVSVAETTTSFSKMKLTLLFAKNFYNFTLRGGMIENTGGLGFDYYFLRSRFRFTAEAFDFSRVNLRTSLTYTLYKGIYLTGGVSDAFNRGNQYSQYLGAGLYFTNEDLKVLLTRMPL